MDDKEKALVPVVKTEHSDLIKKQLGVAHDIMLLSGNQLNQDEALLLSSMYQSEYFKSVDSLSKAITRVVFGKMIGIDVATSLTSLFIIDGKPGLEAKAIRNTLVMAGYDIITKKLDDTECVLEWHYKDKILGNSSFTVQDAVARGYVDRTCVKVEGFPHNHNDREISFYNKWKKPAPGYDKKTGCECKENWRAMLQEMLIARATSKGNTMYGNRAFKQEVYEVGELIESPFREDTTPVDVARSRIAEATTIDALGDITKDLDQDTLSQVLSDIKVRTKELLEDAKTQADNSQRSTEK